MSEPRDRKRRASRAARLALVTLGLAAMLACATVAGIDGLQIGECKGGGVCTEAGMVDGAIPPGDDSSIKPIEGGTFDGSGLPCKSLHGPSMVRVGTDTNNFCIDSTEVTVAQYREFTMAVPDAAGQPVTCAWNSAYTAAFGGPDDVPIAGVDWCDARAYCAWSGKRLCGKHASGSFQGPVSVAELGDFNTNEWLLVCSNLGQLRYPYGGIQQPTACNTLEADAGRSLPVKSEPKCEGGFRGVYDMVGNLWEWFDGPCLLPDGGADAGDAGPAKDECFVKGGAFLNGGVNLDCRVDGRGASRDRRGQEIGIRCCSD